MSIKTLILSHKVLSTIVTLLGIIFGFSFFIQIITIQSYPYVNNPWVTDFKVIGRGDLKITPYNGTKFGTDLDFSKLRCNDNIITPTLITDDYISFENYYCLGTSYFEVIVRSTGKHTLRFEFGNDISYSYNDASISELSQITYTENSIDYRNPDGTGNIIIYGGPRFHQDNTGTWRNISDVFRIGKNEDDIIFYYDGNLGNFSVTFESGITTVAGNYLSMSEVKTNYPTVNFDFPQKQTPTMRKYAVNITNVPVAVQPNVDSITLTYKEHTGFTLDQFLSANDKFNIKGIMKLGFQDLLDNGFTININKSEKRIYISNLTFVDDSLYLDPTVRLNITTGISEDTACRDTLNDYESYTKFPAGAVPQYATIDSAMYGIYYADIYAAGVGDDDIIICGIGSESWTEATGTGIDNLGVRNCSTTTFSNTKFTWSTFNVTDIVTYQLSKFTNISMMFEDPDNLMSGSISCWDFAIIGDTSNSVIFEDSENHEASGNYPYINISYRLEYNLETITPTSSSPRTTSADEEINTTFTFSIGSTNLTSGISYNNITLIADDTTETIANFLTSQTCTGTLDCSQYSTNASCSNCSQCNWSSAGGLSNYTVFSDDGEGWGIGDCGGGTLPWDDCYAGAGGEGDIARSTLEYSGTYGVRADDFDTDTSNVLTKTLDLANCTTIYANFYYANARLDTAGPDHGTFDVVDLDDSDRHRIWQCNDSTDYDGENDNTPTSGDYTFKSIDITDLTDYSTDVNVSWSYKMAGSGEIVIFDELEIICEYGGDACVAADEGACSSCALDECDTNCSTGACSIGTSNQCGVIDGTTYMECNFTAPNLVGGTYDLKLNLTYDGTVYSNTSIDSVIYPTDYKVYYDQNGSDYTIPFYKTEYLTTFVNFSAIDGLNYTWIGNNFTGVWTNQTPVARNSITQFNHSRSIQATKDGSVCWQGYANDSDGDFNQTGIYCYDSTSEYNISIVWNSPTTDYSHRQYQNFTYKVDVSCETTETYCEVNVSIDPEVSAEIVAGADDGYSGPWAFAEAFTWIEIGDPGGSYYNGWFFFNNIEIPDGATIDYAYLETYQAQWDTGTTLLIYADDTDSPVVPSDTADHVSKTRTSTSTAWTSGSGSGRENSSNFAAVIQELVDSYDYSGGSVDIQILVDEDSSAASASLQLYSFEDSNAPKFYIGYTEAVGAKSGLILGCPNEPFCTGTANPYILNISAGTTETIEWTVNATGDLDVVHEVFANVSLVSNNTKKDSTKIINVTVSDRPDSSINVTLIVPTDDTENKTSRAINFSCSVESLYDIDTATLYGNWTNSSILSVLFEDDFSNYTEGSSGSENWAFENYDDCGQQISDGEYNFTTTALAEPIAIRKNFAYTDYTMEAQIKSISGTGGGFFCPRFDTTAHKYEIYLEFDTDTVKVSIYDDVWHNLASEAVTGGLDADKWYKLTSTIVTEGDTNRITVYVDDTLYINITNTSIMDNTDFAILIYDWDADAEVHFDNLTVTEVTPSTSAWQSNNTNSTPLIGDTFNSYTNLTDGVYAWNCQFCDVYDVCSFADANYTLEINYTGAEAVVTEFCNVSLLNHAPITSNGTGGITVDFDINSTTGKELDVQPCLEGTATCQTDTSEILNITNIKGSAISVKMSLSDTLVERIKMYGDTDNDPSDGFDINGTENWTVSDSLADTDSLEVWIKGYFYMASTSDDVERDLIIYCE